LTEKVVHIVSFDVPYPANYGGVIDVFYKIKALHNIGVNIILHCFQYGRASSEKLEDYCQSVHYYPRREGLKHQLSTKPYIVNSRANKLLEIRLLDDNHPIIFEGLHSTFCIDNPKLKIRMKWVRMHNIEHDYYAGLALVEKNWFRKCYFKLESFRLKRYERILKHASGILAISNNDLTYLLTKYKQVQYLPAFHPNTMLECLVGKGRYTLYHGNLAVGENQEAVKFLITRVYSNIKIPLIVAGGGAPNWLKKLIEEHKHITLDEQSDMVHIKKLLQQAQINVLPTFQPTGIKLKLLFALFNGRYCLVNNPMVAETGLEGFCTIADNENEMQQAVLDLFNQDFTIENIEERRAMELIFSGENAAKKLVTLLWNQSVFPDHR
jgi:hypothetical protein